MDTEKEDKKPQQQPKKTHNNNNNKKQKTTTTTTTKQQQQRTKYTADRAVKRNLDQHQIETGPEVSITSPFLTPLH